MKKYNYVAVIGIDGMGGFNKDAETPCMDEIFKDGAYTYEAYSMDPTISAENWGGMLLGAEPSVHNLTNGYISSHEYKNEELPSVFKRIRAVYPDAYLASVVNWNPINIGIVEENLGVDKRTADNDTAVTEEILDCVKNKPVFLFVQLDEVDGAGHHYGYGTDEYLKKISEIDSLAGKIYNAYKEAGIADETLFIALADHGGYNHGHGGWHDTEKRIFFAASGKGVKKGIIPYAVTKDISALVLYALGVEVPAYTPGGFTSQVPQGIFEDYTGEYIKSEQTNIAVVKDTPEFSVLKNTFGEELALCLHFDDSLKDECGNYSVTEHGSVKFYNNGVNGSMAEFGATGAITVDELRFNKNFSLAFWVYFDADTMEQMCIMGNKSPEGDLRQKNGFNVILKNHAVMVQYGCGDDDTDTVTSLKSDGFSGWIHVILTFNLENGETGCFLNFEKMHTKTIEDAYMNGIRNGSVFTIGDDDVLNYNKSRGLIFRIDDFMMFNDILTDSEINSLKEYFGG